MKKTELTLLLLLSVTCLLYGQSDIDVQIQNIENGLCNDILIKGVPVWTLEERMAHYGVPGLSIAVFQDGKILWTRGYGVTNKEKDQPVDENTLFQAASITKPVAATIALQLVQFGRLDLDRNVNEYLKTWKVPDNQYTETEKVTLRRILSHSAGLSVHGFRGYGEGEPVPDIHQVLDGIEPANTDPVRVIQKPGEGFRYSGGGYTLLQLLVEEVTDQSLSDLADGFIFEPAGMTNSSLHKPLQPELADQITWPHNEQGKPLPPHTYLKGGSACCGLWTTAADLARFAIAIHEAYTGKSDGLLSEEIAKAMLSPHAEGGFGLGFGLDPRENSVYFQHSGGNPPGYICNLLAHRDKGYGAVVMTNSSNGGLLIREIFRSIMREYGWEDYAIKNYESLSAYIEHLRILHETQESHLVLSENQINMTGYDLMRSGMTEEAIALLKLNVEFYPKSANGYDSLGEAYEAAGNIKEALTYYKLAVQMLDKYSIYNKRFMNKKAEWIADIIALEAKKK